MLTLRHHETIQIHGALNQLPFYEADGIYIIGPHKGCAARTVLKAQKQSKVKYDLPASDEAALLNEDLVCILDCKHLTGNECETHRKCNK